MTHNSEQPVQTPPAEVGQKVDEPTTDQVGAPAVAVTVGVPNAERGGVDLTEYMERQAQSDPDSPAATLHRFDWE